MSSVRTILISLASGLVGAALAFGVYLQVAPAKTQVINRTVVVNQAKVPKSSKILSPEQIYKDLSPAVVNINVSQKSTDFFGNQFHEGETAMGSGFIIDESGLVVTNEHVVENADKALVTLADNTELEAEVLGTDPNTDLALLKIDPGRRDLTVLKLGDSTNLQVGDTVYAIGNPLGLDRSMSQGIISALNRSIDAPSGFSIRNVIQTDAAINRGNSGGALIDITGKVVGVTAQIATSGGTGNIGIAFAIPSNTVRKIINQIQKTGKAEHAWLGISGRTVTPELAKELDLPVQEGAMVAQVFPNSPADKGGLRGSFFSRTGSPRRVGDIIVKLAGQRVDSMESLVGVVDDQKPGKKVKVEIYRGSSKRTLTITLGTRPTTLGR